MKNSQKYFSKQQEYLASVNGEIEEMYSGHSVIKVFNSEKKMIDNFEKSQLKLIQKAIKNITIDYRSLEKKKSDSFTVKFW